MDTIAVTGVTGGVGGRVASRLGARGIPLQLLTRDPSQLPTDLDGDVRRCEYADLDAMTRGFRGSRVALLVSGRESADRLAEHRTAVTAARDAGVEKLVYTSFLGAGPEATFTLARQHFHTEEFIRASGIDYVFLRDNLYTDSLPYFVDANGRIKGPAGTGRCSFVTRDDVAACAVEVLLGHDHDGATLDVTGPEALTLAEAADRLGQFIGLSIGFVDETEEEAYASRSVYGAPDWEVEGWVSSYLAIAGGEMATVSEVVEQLTGRPPQTLEDFLGAHPESYARLEA